MSWLESGLAVCGARHRAWLHAFPLSSATWTRQLEAMPDGWRSIASPILPAWARRLDHSGTPLIEDFAS